MRYIFYKYVIESDIGGPVQCLEEVLSSLPSKTTPPMDLFKLLTGDRPLVELFILSADIIAKINLCRIILGIRYRLTFEFLN
jgi:hypothetical protein